MKDLPKQSDPQTANHPDVDYKPLVSASLNALIGDTEGLPSPQLAGVTDRQLIESSLVSLNELFRRAKSGQDEPADYIYRLSNRMTLSLFDLIKNPLPSLVQIAHSQPVWPSFYSPNPKIVEGFANSLRRLEVGKHTQLNVSPKSRWTWNGIARHWASQIHYFVGFSKTNAAGFRNDHPDKPVPWPDELTKTAVELPPLTKATAGIWMQKVGWPLVLQNTNGQPEKDKHLRKLGLHRQRHTVTSKPNDKTSESNIRDGIKKLITQALVDMASKP